MPRQAPSCRPNGRSPNRAPAWRACRFRNRSCEIRSGPRASANERCAWRGLLADAEAFNQLGVPIGILALEIVEQAPALADKLQQATPRMMILRVDFEVLCKVVDALAEESDLNFRRSGVAVMRLIAADDPGLAVPG